MKDNSKTAWNDELQLELEELLNQAADDKLSAESTARLQEILLNSEPARRHYVRFRGLESGLAAYAGEAQVQEELPRFPGTQRWWYAAAAAAAVLILAALWHRPATSNTVVLEEAEVETAATLLTMENCEWGQGAFKAGEILQQGQRLLLHAGVAELSFDCGARLVMQGPSELLLRSPWEAFLIKGLVRANVPPEAIGFRVSSPEVDVVDLGTEFSVAADAVTGVSDVLVHEGKVQVRAKAKKPGMPAGSKKALLQQNEGRRFIKNGGVSELSASDSNWKALAGRLRPLRNLVKEEAMLWTFDAPEKLLPAAQQLATKAPSFAQPLPLGPGKYGQGLLFSESQPASPVSVILSSHPGAEARSYAAWIKIAPEATLGDAGTWLTQAPQLPLAGEIALGWNGNPTQGVAGAATLRFGQKQLLGSTPLNDGKWHHVTAMVIIKPRPKPPGLEPHLRLYVDGKLELASAKMRLTLGEIGSAKLATEELRLGMDASGEDAFLGAVDELLIVDRPLNAAELTVLVQESGRK